MTKKKMPQTIEECNAEMERTQKQILFYVNKRQTMRRKRGGIDVPSRFLYRALWNLSKRVSI